MSQSNIPPQDGASYSEQIAYADQLATRLSHLQANIAASAAGTGPGLTDSDVNTYRNLSDRLLSILRQLGKVDKLEPQVAGRVALAEVLIRANPQFTIQMLLYDSGDAMLPLHTVDPAIRAKIIRLLEQASQQLPIQTEMDFWNINNAFTALRQLSVDDAGKRNYDRALLNALTHGAEVVSKSNPSLAADWLAEAADLAKNRLGEMGLSSALLEQAQLARVSARTTPLPTNAQAIVDELQQVVRRGLMERHKARFLPEVNSLVVEHSVPFEPDHTPIPRLLQDHRLLVDLAIVEARRQQFAGKGLVGHVPSKRIDAQENARGWEDANSSFPFLEQYVAEIIDAVGAIFYAWQQKDLISSDAVMTYLQNAFPEHGWQLVSAGVKEHFEGDCISSVHILAPQVEALCVDKASRGGITTKRLDRYNREATVSLVDLLSSDNVAMQGILGPGLFSLAQMFLVESRGGFNIRNKVAHGAINQAECNQAISAGLIFMALHVASLRSQPIGGGVT
jgi:hypothetical protein